MDRVVIQSGSIDEPSSSPLAVGGQATITATGKMGYTGCSLNFFYTSDGLSASPDWQYIGSVLPSASGVYTEQMEFTLPASGSNHAIRVQMSYSSYYHSNPCSPSGYYRERDDLVFAVGGPPTASPTVTGSPTATNSPTATALPLDAVYDSSVGAPVCSGPAISCDSGSLVDSRGTLGADEPNKPNTIDGCDDGNAGSYHSDESNDKIFIRSGDIDESSVDALTQGSRATIVAKGE